MNIYINILLLLMPLVFQDQHAMKSSHLKKNEAWEEKSKKFFFPKHFTNKFVEHGRKFEKEAINAFLQDYHHGSIITPGLIICKQFPWLGFSPDAILFKNGVPTELVEIKCPFIGKLFYN